MLGKNLRRTSNSLPSRIWQVGILGSAMVVCAGSIALSGTAFGSSRHHSKGTARRASAQKTIQLNLGVVQSQSGALALSAIPELQGTEAAIAYFNARQKTYHVHITYHVCNDNSTPTQGATCANQLILQNHVNALLGPASGGVLTSMLPLLSQYSIPDVSGQGAFDSTQVNDAHSQFYWAFSTATLTNFSIRAILDYLRSKGVSKVGMLESADIVGTNFQNGLEQIAPSFHMHITDIEKYVTSATDVTSQLIKIRDSGAKAMLFTSSGGVTVPIQDFAQLGLQKKMIFISQPSVVTPSIFDALGNVNASFVYADADKAVVWQQLPNGQYKKTIKPIATLYERTFKTPYAAFSEAGAQQVAAIVQAAMHAKSNDPSKLRKALDGGMGRVPGFGPSIYMNPQNHVGYSVTDLAIVRLNSAKKTFPFVTIPKVAK